MAILAHFTGIPHHSEEVQSIAAFWPLVLLAIQLIWVIVKQRTSQVVAAALQGLHEARPFFFALMLLAGVYAVVSVARATPVAVLRGPTAQVLGSIEIAPSGVQELRNARRHLLGTYNSRTNQTCDSAGRLVGTGNLLSTLLRN